MHGGVAHVAVFARGGQVGAVVVVVVVVDVVEVEVLEPLLLLFDVPAPFPLLEPKIITIITYSIRIGSKIT